MNLFTLMSLVTLSASTCFAVQNESPILNSGINLDNTILFDSVGGKPVLIPASFSSKFSCASNSVQSYCFLRVFNDLTPDAATALNAMGPDQQNALPLRADLYDQIVENVNEQFGGEVTSGFDSTNQPVPLKSLALLGGTPYVNSTLKTSYALSNQLKIDYAGAGMGIYSASFTLQGVKQYEGLYLLNSNGFKSVIESLRGQVFAYSDWRNWVKNNLSSYTKVKNIRSDETVILVSRYLESQILKRNSNGLLILSDSKWSALQSNTNTRLMIVSELSDPVSVPCKSTLVLKDQAVSTLFCEGLSL